MSARLKELASKPGDQWTAEDTADYILMQHRDCIPAGFFVLAKAFKDRAQGSTLSAQAGAEPVAWLVSVDEHDNHYVVASLDDGQWLDDATNHGAVAEPLYTYPPRAAGPVVPEVAWPKENDVGRFGDMCQTAHLRVGLDSDTDVYVSVWDGEGGASVEFCCPGNGGGASPRTRGALIALMVAMEEDNKAAPHKDWWVNRSGPEPLATSATSEGHYTPEGRVQSEPAKCKTCGGSGMVDDGEIWGSGGVLFENGPVKCMKDCPDCTPSEPKRVELTKAEFLALKEVIRISDRKHDAWGAMHAFIASHEAKLGGGV